MTPQRRSPPFPGPLEVIEDRQKRKSTIFTSQIEIKHWHDIIGEPTVADAILGRLASGAPKNSAQRKIIVEDQSMVKTRHQRQIPVRP